MTTSESPLNSMAELARTREPRPITPDQLRAYNEQALDSMNLLGARLADVLSNPRTTLPSVGGFGYERTDIPGTSDTKSGFEGGGYTTLTWGNNQNGWSMVLGTGANGDISLLGATFALDEYTAIGTKRTLVSVALGHSYTRLEQSGLRFNMHVGGLAAAHGELIGAGPFQENVDVVIASPQNESSNSKLSLSTSEPQAKGRLHVSGQRFSFGAQLENGVARLVTTHRGEKATLAHPITDGARAIWLAERKIARLEQQAKRR